MLREITIKDTHRGLYYEDGVLDPDRGRIVRAIGIARWRHADPAILGVEEFAGLNPVQIW